MYVLTEKANGGVASNVHEVSWAFLGTPTNVNMVKPKLPKFSLLRGGGGLQRTKPFRLFWLHILLLRSLTTQEYKI